MDGHWMTRVGIVVDRAAMRRPLPRRVSRGRLVTRIGAACLSSVTAAGLLVASASPPAFAGPPVTTLVSLPFTGPDQVLASPGPAGSGSIAPLSAVPTSAAGFETGFPCLTAGTDPGHSPIPGCGLAPPDASGSGTLRFN